MFVAFLGLQSILFSEPVFSSPQTFDLSLTQVPAVCQELSRRTGKTFRAGKMASNLKLDIFVENQPLSETLSKVAEVLHCDWTKDQGGYILEMSVPYQNRFRNLLAAYEESQKSENRKKIEDEMLSASLIPPLEATNEKSNNVFHRSDMKPIMDKLNADRRRYSQAKDEKNFQIAENLYSAIVNAPGQLVVGRALNQLDRASQKKFFAGEPFAASTFSRAKTLRAFLSDMQAGSSGYLSRNYGPEDNPELFVIFRWNVTKSRTEASGGIFSKWNRNGEPQITDPIRQSQSWSSSRLSFSDELKKQKLFQELEEWNLETTPTKFPQAIDSKTKIWDSPWYSERRRLGEHLRWFHQSTKIPVVAWANRECLYPWIRLNRKDTTAASYLENLAKTETYFKKSDSFLLARPNAYWLQMDREIPESTWSQFESNRKSPFLTLDEAVRMCSISRPEQIYTKLIDTPISKVYFSPLIGSFEPLRFFGLLSRDQQSLAMSKNGIRGADMNETQRNAFVRLATEGLFNGGRLSYGLAKDIALNGLGANLLSDMYLVVQKQLSDHTTSESELEDDLGYNEKTQTFEKELIRPRRNISFKAQHYQFIIQFSSESSVTIGSYSEPIGPITYK
jgi:hypothetical protein